MTALADYAALRESDPAGDRDPLSVELVEDRPQAVEQVAARVAAALPGVPLHVEAASDPAADRYFFVDFPRIDPRGQEREIFAFARELRRETGAAEANPVLPDSLYGVAHLAGGDESALAGCSTPRRDDLPWGWHHLLIETPAAWRMTQGQGATIAVIDTGWSSHFELADVLARQAERNFVEGGTDARDRFSSGVMEHPGHGTLVMSVAASRGTVGPGGGTGGPGGITGTAPAARVMPVRAIRSVVDISQRRIGPAIDHAVASGADVVAMALGGPMRVAATEAALRRAVNAGAVVVCAAGNCWGPVVIPAAYAPLGICTAVAALQPDRRPWKGTCRGPQVTLSAYGEQVWGAAKNRPDDPDNGIRPAQGTTLATSMTAGVAALWVARHGGRQALLRIARQRGTTVQAMFVHCARHGMSPPPEWGGARDLGAGVLNARMALEAPLPAGTEAVPAPSEQAVSTLNILQMQLLDGNESAVAELTPDMAELAPELIWLRYRAAARRRALEGGVEAAGIAADRPSEAAAEALERAPALAALLGQ